MPRATFEAAAGVVLGMQVLWRVMVPLHQCQKEHYEANSERVHNAARFTSLLMGLQIQSLLLMGLQIHPWASAQPLKGRYFPRWRK
jgi:cytochrome b561